MATAGFLGSTGRGVAESRHPLVGGGRPDGVGVGPDQRAGAVTLGRHRLADDQFVHSERVDRDGRSQDPSSRIHRAFLGRLRRWHFGHGERHAARNQRL